MEVGTALGTRLLLRGGGCSERPQSLSARDHVTVLASCNPPSMSHGLRRYAVTLSEKQFIRSSYEVCLKLFETIMEGKLSFSQDSAPDAKLFAGAAFVGRAAASGATALGVHRGLGIVGKAAAGGATANRGLGAAFTKK